MSGRGPVRQRSSRRLASEQRGHVSAHSPVDQIDTEHLIFGLLEGALVLLAVDPRGERPPLLREELRTYARALLGSHLVALPRGGAAVRPLLEEYAPLARGGGEHEERAARDGEHRPDGEVELVFYPRGLVHDQEIHAREPAHGLLSARQSLDPRAVGEL